MKNAKPIQHDFWSRVRKGDGCWEWTAAKVQGYGQFAIRGQKVRKRAHRHSYEICIGPIPAGLNVCHRCDNPGCVNPAHLFLGTRKENMQDAKAKGRTTFGQKNPQAKLTDANVLEIRRLIGTGMPQKDIAAAFKVWPSAITKIKDRSRWAHLP